MSSIKYKSRNVLFLLALFAGSLVMGQELEQRLAAAVGAEKLPILQELCREKAETQPGEVLAWGKEALALLSSAPNPQMEVDFLLNMALAADKMEENLTTRELAQKALDLALKTGNLNDQSVAYQFLGNSYRRRNEAEPALDYFKKGLELSRQTHNEKVESEILNCIGGVYYQKSELGTAKDYFSQALAIGERLGLDKLIATGHANVGYAYTLLDELEKGMEHQLKSLETYRRMGDRLGEGMTFMNLGTTAYALQKFQVALEYNQKALALYEQSQEKPTIMRIKGNIAAIYRKMGRNKEARATFHELLKLSKATEDRRAQITFTYNLGLLEEAEGHFSTARTYLNQALTIAEEMDLNEFIATVHTGLARLERQLGDQNAANAHIEKAFQLVGNEITPKVVMGIQEEAALIYAGLGDYQRALTAYQAFHKLSLEIGSQDVEKNLDKLEQQYKAREREQQIVLLKREGELQTVKAAEQARIMELSMIKKDNQIKELDLSRQRTYQIASLILFFGAAAFVALYLRNQRRSLAQERLLNKKLQQLDTLKDEFLAKTSHELRTPLTGIVGLAEALMHQAAPTLGEEARTDLAMIAASGKRLSVLVNDLLDFSKLRNHELQLHPQQVNLEALTGVVLHVSKRLAANEVALINNVPKDLPPVAADENRLQQILFNLVGNAVKFTAQGSVTVSAAVEQDKVVVRVTDTGIGIDPENLQTIFQAFEQGEQHLERSYGGTGLGLAISKHLAALHGGDLQVESTRNQGSTFSFSLPLADAATPIAATLDQQAPETLLSPLIASPEEEDALQPKVYSAQEHQPHVLIVDDEAVNRRVLRHHLAHLDVKVSEASSGEQALALLKENRYDLVLLDIMMPRLSGYEVCKQLRASFSQQALPVVFLSAKNRLVDLVEGFHCGGNDYLVKPFLKAELLARVQLHLDLVASYGAVERLRGQIAQDLHDEVGGLLTQISLQAEWLQIVPGLADKVKAKADKIGQAARAVVKSFRDVIWSLDARNDTSEQLVFRIRETAKELLDQQPDCEYEVVATNLPSGISPEKRRNIFLICKEALNNIVKHANATKILISLEDNARCFKLCIRDNGTGFAQKAHGSGLGLHSMQSRALSLGGQLQVLHEAGVKIQMECQSLMLA